MGDDNIRVLAREPIYCARMIVLVVVVVMEIMMVRTVETVSAVTVMLTRLMQGSTFSNP